MVRFRVTIKRSECIACGSCYNLDPDHFEAGEKGYSRVVNGETTPEISEGVFEDDGIDKAQEAADLCPVEIITVEKLSGKK
ncbi:MAG: ferredoxin [Candidatus Heimdallarchaeota archaeon]|nr:ferredoxin [Candidatus Heimdallarchaeota archaeon]